MDRYFKKIGINSDRVSPWKPKGLSEESIKFPSKFNNCLAPALSYFGNKTKVKFDGSSLKQDKVTFTHGNIINIYISYKIKLWPNQDDNFTPTSSLFGAVDLTENAKKRKCKYLGYRIGFDRFGTFSLSNSSAFCRNVIIFWSRYEFFFVCRQQKKDIFILGKGPTQRIRQYHINFKKRIWSILQTLTKIFCLSLHYNGSNSSLFVNGVEIIKFKSKYSDIKATWLCLGNVSKEFLVD